MKVKDVIAVIEEFAPLSIQEGWDNSGLCVGSPDAPVKSVLLGLDCTPELVDEAIAFGADMIVTHHPMIFSGLKKISPEDKVGQALIKAIKADISIYAAHTSADKVIAGVSGAMAARLGLVDALYERERPFILLDDPFTAFDDGKTEAALKLLKELSRDRQIIYFTCAKSRSI